MLVREAVPSDAPALAAMRYAFRASLGRATEEQAAFLARCRAWMAEHLGGAGPWRCWVAEDAGALVGHLWLETIEKLPNPVGEAERHAYVTNVYVQPAARGQGVGGRLLDAALRWCRESGVDSIILWATPASRTLHARHGFREPEELMEADAAEVPGEGRG
jgi:GNAT superfamily N-acetyltransferase